MDSCREIDRRGEMKYEDISEVTGTSVGALKASYHHAVKKIEEYLGMKNT